MRFLLLFFISVSVSFGALTATFTTSDALHRVYSSASIQYISSTGNDANSGTQQSPKLTIASAQAALGNIGTIVVESGTYVVSGVLCDLTSAIDLKIVAAANTTPRFKFGYPYSGANWTKTVGKTNVYQATVSIGTAAVYAIYEDGTNYRTILAADRHPLHRGRTYALDTYPLTPLTNTTDVDANAATFYYDSDNHILYIHTPASDSPITNGKTYYVGGNGYFAQGGTAGKTTKLTIKGIEIYYATIGINPSYTDYLFERVRVVGSRQSGVTLNYCQGTDIRCEYAANGIDGFGQAYLDVSTSWPEMQSVSIDSYFHDNFDDGQSNHMRGQYSTFGGLSEFNRDRGFDPAYGGHASFFNSVAQWNGYNNTDADGQATNSKGEGFCATVAAPDGEGGVGTDVNLYNCISHDNFINIGANAGSAVVVNMYGGMVGTVGASVGQAKFKANNAKINLYGVTEYGTGTTKTELNGGTVTVVTPTAIQ